MIYVVMGCAGTSPSLRTEAKTFQKGEPVPFERWPFDGAYLSDRAMQGAFEKALKLQKMEDAGQKRDTLLEEEKGGE